MQGAVTTAQADSRACEAHSGFSTQHSEVAQLWWVCTTQPAAAGPQHCHPWAAQQLSVAASKSAGSLKLQAPSWFGHSADKAMQGKSNFDRMGAEQTCRVPLVYGSMNVEGSGFWLTVPRHNIAL